MDLRHLKMIKEVAQTKSLAKAAENLFLTSSALSHQLKEVEDYFQTAVFARQNKQMILTRAGEVILLYGRKILDEMDEARNTIRQMMNKDQGEIRIGTECFTSYHWLSGFLKDFKKYYPRVETTISTDTTQHLFHQLLGNQIDIAIFQETRHKNKLSYTPLFSDELFVIVPPDHPWASLSWIDPNILHTEPFIMYDIPVEESSLYQMLFRRQKPKKLYQISLTEARLEMVKAGVGFTILPHWVAYKYLISNELSAIRLTRKGIKRTWHAAVLKSRVIPPFMELFISKLDKHMKKSSETKKLKVA